MYFLSWKAPGNGYSRQVGICKGFWQEIERVVRGFEFKDLSKISICKLILKLS